MKLSVVVMVFVEDDDATEVSYYWLYLHHG